MHGEPLRSPGSQGSLASFFYVLIVLLWLSDHHQDTVPAVPKMQTHCDRWAGSCCCEIPIPGEVGGGLSREGCEFTLGPEIQEEAMAATRLA